MPINPNSVFVAVAGNIGSGKSSLTALLAQKFGWQPFYEIVDTNPYLTDFYRDMQRWSFHLQMFFLTKRFEHQTEILNSPSSVIQDRTIYEDAEIFAKNLFLTGRMFERDYRTYTDHFKLMTSFLRTPDLLIYLRADVPTLVERIALRGREYEQAIPADYLEQLNERYESWVSTYDRGPLMTIDVNRLDFVNSTEHLDQVAKEVSWEIEKIKNLAQKTLPLGASHPQRRSYDRELAGLELTPLV